MIKKLKKVEYILDGVVDFSSPFVITQIGKWSDNNFAVYCIVKYPN